MALAGILLASRVQQRGGRHHLWTSAGLIGVGMFDLAHAAVVPGNMFVWFHSTATFTGGVLFALVWLPIRPTHTFWARLLPPLTAVATLVVCACSLWFPRVVPAMVEQGTFTPAAHGLNILGGLGFLAAAVWFLRRCRPSRRQDDLLFAYLCCLFGATGILFAQSILWDAAWWWWHLLRLMAYSLALCYCAAAYYRTSQRIHQEIADRKRAEASLEIERQQFISMFDGMEETVYVADSETHELLYMNRATRRLWGDRVGETCYRVMQNRDSPCPFCTNDRIFGEKVGQPYIWEFQNEVTWRWYRCFDRAIRWPDGRMVRFEMAIDIHERKQTEEELNQRVQEVSDAKRRLEVLVSSTTEREQRMVALKQEVNDLLQALGRETKYDAPRQVAELHTGSATARAE